MTVTTKTQEIPLVDLKAQYATIKDEVRKALDDVLESMQLTIGPNVRAFDQEWAAYCGTKHSVGVGSGTDALQLAIRACGVSSGDEVITVSHTFFATVEAILYASARPILVDVDEKSMLMDASAVAAAITPRTKAIIPVHLYGRTADMKPLRQLAQDRGIAIIEDAAQAHGARYNGQRVGGFGHAAAFSFYPSKNLGAYGDGGMIVTNDDRTAEKLRLLRNYGQRAKYDHSIAGTNSRLDTVQAAILRVKLPHLDEWNAARRRHADSYGERLPARVDTPSSAAGVEHVYHLYVIETDHRDAVQQQLRAKEIATGIHYPVPVHLQQACANLGYRAGDFPVTERAAQRMLSLPMYPELTTAQIEYVSDAVTEAVKRAG